MNLVKIASLIAAVAMMSGCAAHWTGYDLYANAGLQQNDGEMATKATTVYSVGAKIHFDRDK